MAAGPTPDMSTTTIHTAFTFGKGIATPSYPHGMWEKTETAKPRRIRRS
jgi:hypothetical protein